MTEYLVFKLERFGPEGGSHVASQVKYFCEEIMPRDSPFLKHPYTDDNPYRLFGQIASFYKKGDKIVTIPEAEICDDFDGTVVELKEPLNHDELRILAIQILEKLSGG